MSRLDIIILIILYVSCSLSFVIKHIRHIHRNSNDINKTINKSLLYSSTSDTIANLITQTKDLEVEAMKCIDNAQNSKELDVFRVLYLGDFIISFYYNFYR